MKTYLFVIPSAFRVNAILRTAIRTYLEKDRGAKIVIISPFAEKDYFKKEFPTAIHETLPKIPLRFVRKVARVRELLLSIDKPVFITSRLIEKSVMARKPVTSLSSQEKLFSFLRFFLYPLRPGIAWLYNKIEENALYSHDIALMVKKHNAHGIIVGTLTEPDDIVWLAQGRRFNIPAHVVDFPWSYIENRLWAVPRPAHLYLWSEMMKEELLTNFPLHKKYAHSTGCQRYDWYRTAFPTISKEEFFKRIGVDTTQRLITYFIGTPYWNPHELDTARVILEMIQRGELPKNTTLVARLGWKLAPSDPFLALQKQYPNFLIQSADELPHQENPSHLVYYSDVTMSTFSSLALDAAVLDRPHIFTALSGFDTTHPDDAATAKIFEYEFVKNAVGTGGVRVAYDKKTFTSLMLAFVQDPSTDREERRALVKKFLGTIDGKAGERIAQLIASL